jgi:hypothetical protein
MIVRNAEEANTFLDENRKKEARAGRGEPAGWQHTTLVIRAVETEGLKDDKSGFSSPCQMGASLGRGYKSHERNLRHFSGYPLDTFRQHPHERISGAGSSIMKRIAAPMIGGVFTSFILELMVYPVLYEIWKWNFELKRPLVVLDD